MANRRTREGAVNCLQAFGPYGDTSDCYFAMQSDNLGVVGSATFQCVYTKNDEQTSAVTWTWGLPEGLPTFPWGVSNPVNDIVVNTQSCDKRCNLSGSVVVNPD